MDLTKLGKPALVLTVVGLLALVDSFLPWYSVSEKALYPGMGVVAGSTNAWQTGIGAWFPLLALIALGVLAVLPAFGRAVTVRGGYAAVGTVALVAVVVVLLRWATYPSLPAEEAAFVDAGAAAGTYLGLLLAAVATAAAYLGFTAEGGTLQNLGAAFRPRPPETVAPPESR